MMDDDTPMVDATTTTTTATTATTASASPLTRPLLPNEKRQRFETLQALRSFWSQPSFARGVVRPPFAREDVDALLRDAAEMVVRVRLVKQEDATTTEEGAVSSDGASTKAAASSLLRASLGGSGGLEPAAKQQQHPRTRVGAAYEFLFSFGSLENEATLDVEPVAHPEAFTRALVHACFQEEGHRYTAGYSEELVDRCITGVERGLEQKRAGLLATLDRRHSEVGARVGELLSQTTERHAAGSGGENSSGDDGEPSHVPLARADFEDVRRVNEKLKGVLELLAELDEHRAARQRDLAERHAHALAQREQRLAEMRAAREAEEAERRRQQEEAEAAEAAAREAAEAAERETEAAKSGMLKIQKVADDVHEVEREIEETSTQIHDVASMSVDQVILEQGQGDARSALGAVRKAENRLNGFADRLMRELTRLDEITGSAQIRPARKEQVKAVQALISDVDKLSDKLRGVAGSLRERAEAQAEAEAAAAKSSAAVGDGDAEITDASAPAEEVQEQQDQDDGSSGDESDASAASSSSGEDLVPTPDGGVGSPVTEEDWRSLRLRPKFDAEERPHMYALNTYIPGMARDEVKIELGAGNRTLTVSGFRAPSEEELGHMKRQLAQLRAREHGNYYFPGVSRLGRESDAALMLRLGAGRFGAFQETFDIPASVNVDGITASYDQGVLEISLPKRPVQRRQMPLSPQYRAPARGYPQGQHARRAGHPFFGRDNDFFW